METKLRAFLASPRQNSWIKTKSINVYLRKSQRLHRGKLISLLDIASIEVHPKYRRRGRLKDFLKLVQGISPYNGMYIENCHSEILKDFLYRLQKEDSHWHDYYDNGGILSFMWVK